ncbi:hypothetical protein [Tolumonas lignilytica]|uniref:hypothetical protein n=1 Tax=Tolumonas lignilytica TaxID=1283284 RepID=UPI00046517E3|nr:hypothetical protein [Tolumonas lignilytica]
MQFQGIASDNPTVENIVITKLIFESYQDGITATAGGGQSNAYQMLYETNRITTVANIGDSVKLPAAQAGLTMFVINHGANAMQVYGTGTDTIDDVAAASGVSQMAGSNVMYTCTTNGLWYSNGIGTGYSGQLPTTSYTNGITARAGGGQSSAIQLTTNINRVTTVATAGDSVKLPASAPGLQIIVVNSGANSMQVFGAGTDTINGVATATGISQMPNSVYNYVCTVAGTWVCESVGQGFSGNYPTVSTASALTAKAGGGQAGATLASSSINRFSTVATAGDSGILPASAPGMQITVINAGAASMNLFPATGEQINSAGANTAYAIAAGKTALLSCAITGQWHAVLSA